MIKMKNKRRHYINMKIIYVYTCEETNNIMKPYNSVLVKSLYRRTVQVIQLKKIVGLNRFKTQSFKMADRSEHSSKIDQSYTCKQLYKTCSNQVRSIYSILSWKSFNPTIMCELEINSVLSHFCTHVLCQRFPTTFSFRET